MAWWRRSFAALTGVATASLGFGLVQLFLLVASDAAPSLAAQWAPVVVAVGMVAAGAIALVASFFVSRSEDGPALVRRLAVCIGTSGAVTSLGGFFLILVPARPAVHPGEAPAGDVAGVVVAALVVYAGVGLLAVGVLAAVAAVAWSWARQRSRRSDC